MKKTLFIIAIFFTLLMVFLLLRYGLVQQTEWSDDDKAIRLFTETIDSGELSQEKLSITYYNRGNAWSNKGKYNRAIADYTKAIEIDPEYADAYHKRALAWKKKGNYKKAVADYKKATDEYKKDSIANITRVIELDPKNAEAYYKRGNVWYEKGNYNSAIAEYTKARGDYNNAIADYTKAIEIDPQYAKAYNKRGLAWKRQGNYDKAIADYTKAIEINSNYAEAYSKLAWLKATCPDSKYRDGLWAVELAKKAVELKEAYYTLGTLAAAYAEAGKFQDAIKTQKRAIEKHKKECYSIYMTEYRERLASYKAGKPWRSNL